MRQIPKIILLDPKEMQARLNSILLKEGFTTDRALQCAEVFTTNSVDGIYTHGINRFPRFVKYLKEGYVKVDAEPTLENKYGGIEQWNGNLAPGISNALFATDHVTGLAQKHGIGCVTLKNTNHWMRGGTYGWKAAKAGCVFISWTNTIANMPAWGAKDARLGNNPLVMAIPHKEEAIVLDMAVSQFSYGAIELAAIKNETLSVYGGYDNEGSLTKEPSKILASNRSLPIGYWKGSGLALLLDLLATILSGGLATYEITNKEIESEVSQVFIAIDISKLGNHSSIAKIIENILNDYHHSMPEDELKKIVYPGEKVLHTRQNNLTNGIPVLEKIWDEINQL
ncbi:MAG: 3-dehydro-L-gulonate 2-dehydrogenase [Ginsengibacter sp.]